MIRIRLLALLVFTASFSSTGQVLRLADLNTTQISALPRDKTVIIMPGGVMEQHGPYPPSFSDGFRIPAAGDRRVWQEAVG